MDSTDPIPVPDPVTVHGLAYALCVKPFQVIHELLELDRLMDMDSELDFDLAARVSERMGRQIVNAGPG